MFFLSILIDSGTLLWMEDEESARFHLKYLKLCFEDKRKSCIFIFGWTNLLNIWIKMASLILWQNYFSIRHQSHVYCASASFLTCCSASLISLSCVDSEGPWKRYCPFIIVEPKAQGQKHWQTITWTIIGSHISLFIIPMPHNHPRLTLTSFVFDTKPFW